MAEPITVAVRRGDIVEARHTVHAVAVRARCRRGSGRRARHIHAVVGEADPGAAGRPCEADLDDRELAIASASHLADPQQLGAVRSLLAKAPAQEDELSAARRATRRARSGTTAPESTPDSWRSVVREGGTRAATAARPPVQRTMLAEVAAAADLLRGGDTDSDRRLRRRQLRPALERMAYAFSRFAELDGGSRVADAMQAHPALIRGPGA